METGKTNRKDVERRPRSYRRREWDSFQDLVGHFVECHTVPKHGDFPKDRVTTEPVESLIGKIRALAERFGMDMRGRLNFTETMQRPGSSLRKQDLRDLMRIAHLAGVAYFKLAQVVETAELRRTFRFRGTDIYVMARRYGDMWVTDCPHPVHEIGSAPSLALIDIKEGTFHCPTCKWRADLMNAYLPGKSRETLRMRGAASINMVVDDAWKNEMLCEPWTEYGTTKIRRRRRVEDTPDE